MQGAREYANMFGTNERHGKLRLVSGSHARGKTFHIYVTPDGEKEIEVYGITGGQPGWTETYGWLHKGKWQEDFAAIVESRRKEIAEKAAAREAVARDNATANANHTAALLAKY